MSAPINDGGPAFPSVYYSEPIGSIGPQLTIKGGATLRDYFAAAALHPLVTSAIELDHVKWDATAQHAYLIADAMLKAREAK
jgi:hypothetical protein